MKNFKLNSISITDYEGNGEPLIFIHAFPLCNRMWDSQVEFFKNNFRVITYDLRGLGYSNELDEYLFTMEEHVNDFFSILNNLKLEKVNVCGLSLGGYILMRAVLKDQSRFKSVIFADTKAEGEDNLSLLARSNTIVRIKSGDKDKFLDEFLIKLISEESYNNEEIKNFVKLILSWADVKGLCANLMAIATRTNSFYMLKDINIPALVIVGRKDVVTPVLNSFFLKEGIKNSAFNVIEGAGHLSNIDKPKEFNEAVENFLKQIK